MPKTEWRISADQLMAALKANPQTRHLCKSDQDTSIPSRMRMILFTQKSPMTFDQIAKKMAPTKRGDISDAIRYDVKKGRIVDLGGAYKWKKGEPLPPQRRPNIPNHPDSLANRVRQLFKANPSAVMNSGEIARALGINDIKKVSPQMCAAVKAGRFLKTTGGYTIAKEIGSTGK